MKFGAWTTPGRCGRWLGAVATFSFALFAAAPSDAQRSGASTPSPQYSAQAGAKTAKTARTAKSAKSPLYEPMRVVIARSAHPGCEPDCVEWIAAQGRIDHTTPAAFRRALAKLGTRKLPVLIVSHGGTVDHGLEVGRLLRAKGLDVVVGKTVLLPCTLSKAECRNLKKRGVEFGTPVAKFSVCASSCAFILAGGVRRYVGAWTGVGLHEIRSIATIRRVQRLYRVEQRAAGWGSRPKVRKVLLKERTLWTKTVEGPSSEKAYDRIARFFVEMGVSAGVMPLLRSAPHSSIRALTASELKATRLATHFSNGEQLIAALAVDKRAPADSTANTLPALPAPAQRPSGEPAGASVTAPPIQSGSIEPASAPAAPPAGDPKAAKPPPEQIAQPKANLPRQSAAVRKPRPRPAEASPNAWSPFSQ